MTQNNRNSNRVVRHISISFKDFLPLSTNASISIGSSNNTSEKNSNRRNSKTSSRRGSVLKENALFMRSISRSVRREKLKQLSTGYKLRKNSDADDKTCDNSVESSMCIKRILDFLNSRKQLSCD